MAWLSRVNFTASDVLSYTDLNNLGNDIRAWGGNVNGGGYTLSNVILSASSGTMATVIGGTGTTSTLTLRSTSGVGTTGADIIFQAGNNGATEVMRLQNGGNVGIGTSSPGNTKLNILYAGSEPSLNPTAITGFFAGVSGYAGLALSQSISSPYTFSLQARHQSVDNLSYPISLNPLGGNVGIGTSSPATSAKLEIAGTTGALLVPRLTTTQRNALTAVNGMIIYNTTDNQMQGYINGAWAAM